MKNSISEHQRDLKRGRDTDAHRSEMTESLGSRKMGRKGAWSKIYHHRPSLPPLPHRAPQTPHPRHRQTSLTGMLISKERTKRKENQEEDGCLTVSLPQFCSSSLAVPCKGSHMDLPGEVQGVLDSGSPPAPVRALARSPTA